MLKINPVFTVALCLLPRLSFSEPSLIIPLGSYMETVSLSSVHVADNKLYWSGRSIDLDCWQAGHDIYLNINTLHFMCITRTRDVENAARFLYSTLIPGGSYLQSCTGLLKTPVSLNGKTRYYLYASCRRYPIENSIQAIFKSQKIDITDCPAGHLVNQDGSLVCEASTTPRRQIVSGSYLTSGCDVTESYYNPSLDQMTTLCEKRPYSISNVKSAIDSGKDVVYQNQSLEFAYTSQGAATIHEASLYLPPGNYTLSCQNAAFFPCMGQTGKGLLVAKCLPERITAYAPLSQYKSAFLEDADDQCAMHNMGYVSNINGELVCDPDIEFDYEEDPTQAGLVEHLQCPVSK